MDAKMNGKKVEILEHTEQLDFPRNKNKPSSMNFVKIQHCIPTDLTQKIEKQLIKNSMEKERFYLCVGHFLLHRYTNQDKISIFKSNQGEIERVECQYCHSLNFYDVYKNLKTTSMNIKSDYFCSDIDLFQQFYYQYSYNQLFENRLKFFLKLFVNEANDKMILTLEYEFEMFSVNVLSAFLENYIFCLENFACYPFQPLKDFSVLCDEEKKINTFSEGINHFTDTKMLHQAFEKQVSLHPDNIALVFKSEKITYSRLNNLANKLAFELQKLNVSSQTIVALGMDRSLELVITIIAILKAGGIVLPLDVEIPQSRLRTILNISQPKVVVVSTTTNDIFNFYDGIRFRFDLETFRSDHDGMNLPLVADENSACFCFFTSGSTGEPKGVIDLHKGLVNNIEFFQQTFNVQSNDIILYKSSIGFDISINEIFSALSTGARLIIAIPNGQKDLLYLINLIQEECITIVNFVPSMLSVLLYYLNNTYCPSLRLVITGGDVLDYKTIKMFQKSFKAKLYNAYGPTEASIYVTYWDCCNIDDSNKIVLIGAPILNTQIHIVDKFNNIVPIGVVGEICISGISLARGYLRRDDLTAERFIFCNKIGKRIYKTGDYGRYLDNGMIEFICRIDHQIKVRGNRIEVAEIEETVKSQCQVKQVLVTDFQDETDEKCLVLYAVPNTEKVDKKKFCKELKSAIANTLPAYMVPSKIIILKEFPLNINQKIDKKMLPSPVGYVDEVEAVVPETETESKLLHIWSKILNIPTCDINDSFLELGGTSIKAIYLVSDIKNVFSKQVSLGEILQNVTIKKLAKLIENKELENTKLNLLTNIARENDKIEHEPFPLSDIQNAYFLGRHDYFDLGSVTSYFYVENVLTELDLVRFNNAINILIQRHPMLRILINDDFTQMISAKPQFNIVKVNDLKMYDTLNAKKQILEIRRRLQNAHYDRSNSSLYNVEISYLKSHEIIIHFRFDLMLFDGRSIDIFFNELSQFYDDINSHLSEIKISFRDYMLAIKSLENSNQFIEAKNYWLSRISTLPDAPELPVNISPDVKTTFVNRSFTISKKRWEFLKLQACQMNVTPAVLICTIYAKVISIWSRNSKFTLNLMFFNRLPIHEHVENVIGNFSTTTLLEVDFTEEKCFREEINKLQRLLWKDLQHSLFNGVKVLQEINRQNGGSIKATMPIIFAYNSHNDSLKKRNRFSYNSSNIYRKLETPHVWLEHQVLEDDNGGLIFSWDSLDELFPENLLNNMFELYKLLVNGFNEWNEPIAKFLQTKKFNNCTKSLYSLSDSLKNANNQESELINFGFIENVRNFKNKIALINGDIKITYSELYNIAYQLNLILQCRKVAFNTPIAIVMRKSWEQIAAVLAVHLFGCYYVPIDANLPQERIFELIKISTARAIITHSSLIHVFDGVINLPILTVSKTFQKYTSEITIKNKQVSSDLAYMIFTSGSTGVPKLVMIEHNSVLNTILDINRKFQVTSSDTVLCLSSLSFDLSVYDIYGLLNAGGTLVIPESHEEKDSSCWKNLIDAHNVTIWNSVPQFMQIYVDNFINKGYMIQKSLRLVMLSGDWIPISLPKKIFENFGSPKLVSLGGATEASIWSNYYVIENANQAWSSIPYGKALENQVLTVLDDLLYEKPTWVPGMIYIGGKGLARGYFDDEEKTKSAFIYHPVTKQRLYRTGDHGRFLPSGDIEILGREDNQVKIQGYRVELAEIEATIAKFKFISDVSVQVIRQSEVSSYLVALIKNGINTWNNDDKKLFETELKEYISRSLPYYMIPHQYIFVEKIPITSNGKIDKNAITNLSKEAILKEAEGDIETDLTYTEQLVKEIWKNLLNLEEININCNFFEIGGQSFTIFQMINEISKKFRIDITVSVILKECTIKKLSRVIDDICSSKQSNINENQTIVKLNNFSSNDKYLFFIHPIGGNIFCYNELSKYFAERRSFFAIQSPALMKKFPEKITFEAMATEYLKLIKSVQKKGPYLLGGWSFGGIMAFEIARQLQSNGEEYDPVLLIDSPAPYPRENLDEKDILSWFNKDFETVLKELNSQTKEAFFEVMKLNIKILSKYNPCKSNISVVIFKAEKISISELENHKYSNYHDWGWSTITDRIEKIFSLPGDHYSILKKDSVQKLAEHLLNLNFI